MPSELEENDFIISFCLNRVLQFWLYGLLFSVQIKFPSGLARMDKPYSAA